MTLIETDLLLRPSQARLSLVPILSTLAGSATAVLPFITTAPILPPLGLVMALAWRLLRPEMWPAWVALPLGLADDLLSGAQIGSATTLWTIAFLAIDVADHRPMWRDHWLDWGLASIAILFCALGGWALQAFAEGAGLLWPIVPQIAVTILVFPAAARLCARLDRWRLAR